MAVSTPATMSSVYAEYGAPAGTSLSAFLRGGAWVPNGPGANAGVPTSLPLSLSQLAGSIKYTFSSSASPTSLSGTRATAGSAITSAASTCSTSGQTGAVTYSWNVTTTGGLTIAATSPTAATTTFFATVNGTNPNATGTATCTAHDAGGGGNAVTNSVTINLSYTGP